MHELTSGPGLVSTHVCLPGPQAWHRWALEREKEEVGQDAQEEGVGLEETSSQESPWTGAGLGEASPFFSRVPRTRETSRRTAVPLLGSTAPCTQLSRWFPYST